MRINLKKCALCGSDDKLELSHIVPKMVVRALKKSSVGAIRSTENPDQTVQDSEKHYMLCGKCEDLFSEHEKYFSDIMFQPYLKHEKTQYAYDERLFFFLTSLSWRSLYLDLLDFVENSVVGIDALETLIEAEGQMRDFLLKKRADLDGIEHHIFFFDVIESVSGNYPGDGLRPHATIHRGITSYTFCNESEGTYVTLSNLMGLMVITLYKKGKNECWENTQIVNGIGIIEAKNQHMTSIVANEMMHIMKMTQNAADSMSEKQQEKAKERLEKVGSDIKNKAVYQDWMADSQIEKA